MIAFVIGSALFCTIVGHVFHQRIKSEDFLEGVHYYKWNCLGFLKEQQGLLDFATDKIIQEAVRGVHLVSVF